MSVTQPDILTNEDVAAWEHLRRRLRAKRDPGARSQWAALVHHAMDETDAERAECRAYVMAEHPNANARMVGGRVEFALVFETADDIHEVY